MRIQSPIVGKCSGSSGNLIFQSYHGKVYVRTHPVIYHYPDTPNQKTTQSKFFAIQRQWWPIYNALKYTFTKEQRRNKNSFNILSSGIYLGASTYPQPYRKNPPHNFGLDTYNHVFIAVESSAEYVTRSFVRFIFKNFAFKSDIRFSPLKFIAIAINVTTQSLMMISDDFNGSLAEVTFENTIGAESGQTLRLYLCLADDHFTSNFYLLLPC